MFHTETGESCRIIFLVINIHSVIIVFIDEVEGANRRIINKAGGRVCNLTIFFVILRLASTLQRR